MKRFRTTSKVTLLTCALMWVSVVQATVPQLYIRVTENMRAGRLRDGMLLAQVRITYPDNHCGFQVWSEVPKVNGQPERYALAGKNASNQVLHVRLKGQDWKPDTQGGKGLMLESGEISATLQVLADGNQVLQPQIWPLLLQGAATGCR